MRFNRAIVAAGAGLGLLFLAGAALAEEPPGPVGTAQGMDVAPVHLAPAPRKPRQRRRGVVPPTPVVPAARQSPASGVTQTTDGQATGTGGAGGASGTAGGISGARRVGNVQGVSASPTAPTSLPPGTLDLGNGLTFLANYTSESAGNPFGGIRQGVRYAEYSMDLHNPHEILGNFVVWSILVVKLIGAYSSPER